jgi:hypothetical protein
VNKYIVTLFVGNKSVTLLVVKPLNCTFHYDTSKMNKKLYCYRISVTSLRIA